MGEALAMYNTSMYKSARAAPADSLAMGSNLFFPKQKRNSPGKRHEGSQNHEINWSEQMVFIQPPLVITIWNTTISSLLRFDLMESIMPVCTLTGSRDRALPYLSAGCCGTIR